MNALQDLIQLAQLDSYPDEAIEAAKVILVHDLAVAKSAARVVGHLLEDPYGEGVFTDLATGRSIDMPSAVSRNGQLIHALTQDDTHLPAMTHVGATTLPLLIALAQQDDNSLTELLNGLAAAFAAAEFLGLSTAPALSGRGIRPTPVIGPIAAVVAAACMQQWSEERLARAIGRVAASAIGTTQAWVDGSHEWLFEISVAGLIALSAARSSSKDWQISHDPIWGPSGLFRCLGLAPSARGDTGLDHVTGATRANVKRLPACAINQVPMVLLQERIRKMPLLDNERIRLRLSPPEATYPGIGRHKDLQSWSARLMSLPYCMTVMAATGRFVVDDLIQSPESISEARMSDVEVVPEASLQVGEYEVEIVAGGDVSAVLKGSLEDVGRPKRGELRHAALASLGDRDLDRAMNTVDRKGATVRELAGIFATS